MESTEPQKSLYDLVLYKAVFPALIFLMIVMWILYTSIRLYISGDCKKAIKRCKRCASGELEDFLAGCHDPKIQPPCTVANIGFCTEKDKVYANRANKFGKIGLGAIGVYALLSVIELIRAVYNVQET